MAAVLLAILLLLTVAAIPRWGYSAGWGWYPSFGLGLVFVAALLAVSFGLR
jgi:hypothetical protein